MSFSFFIILISDFRGAAVAPSFRLKSDGTGCFDPFARGEGEAVEAGLIFKGLEFETFKIRVVDLFPDADEFEGVAVTHPTVDQHVIPKFLGHVGEGDVVSAVLRDDGDGCSLNLYTGAFGFTHGAGAGLS